MFETRFELDKMYLTAKSMVSESEIHLSGIISVLHSQFFHLERQLQVNFPQAFGPQSYNQPTYVNVDDRYMRYLDGKGPRTALNAEVRNMVGEAGLELPPLTELLVMPETNKVAADAVHQEIMNRLLVRCDAMDWFGAANQNWLLHLLPGQEAQNLPAFSLEEDKAVNTGFYNMRDRSFNKDAVLVVYVAGSSQRNSNIAGVKLTRNTCMYIFHPPTRSVHIYVRHPVEDVWIRDEYHRYIDYGVVAEKLTTFFDHLGLPNRAPYKDLNELSEQLTAIVKRHGTIERYVQLARLHNSLADVSKKWYVPDDKQEVHWKLSTGGQIRFILELIEEGKALALLEFSTGNGGWSHHDRRLYDNHMIKRTTYQARQLLLTRFEEAVLTLMERDFTNPNYGKPQDDTDQRNPTDVDGTASATSDAPVATGE